MKYLRAEAAYADAMMAPTKPLQETLYRQMLSHVQEDDTSPPYVDGAWRYWVREDKGKQYPAYLRAPTAGGAPQVMLDVDQLARGKKFLAVRGWEVSDDGRRLAYLLDETGFRDNTLYVKDLVSGKTLPDRLRHVSAHSWCADARTLFYVVDNAAKRAYRLYRHELGQPQARDTLVFEEKDERFDLTVGRTRSLGFVVATTQSHTASEVRVLDATTPRGEWRVIAPRADGLEYYVENGNGLFYIFTNDTARNFRVVTAPVATPDRAHWKELVAASPTTLIEGITAFTHFLVVSEREQALSQLRVLDLRTGVSRRIAMPEPVFEVGVDANHVFDSDVLRYNYESLTTPTTWVDYDMDKQVATPVKRLAVPGGYDPARYVTERLWATASDGARVPISLVRRADVPRDGTAPLLLSGYGAYGQAYEIEFDPAAIPLLDRGVVLASAHVRGGGDLGKAWHDEGRMLHKRNSFTDFIAASELLIAQKYVARDRLVITGGSAGGLLIGAVLNMRPELFRAAIVDVPFVDVINTMLDETLPMTVGEFEEWGNPKDLQFYRYMLGYSPYDNVRAQAYPAMLVRSALNDSQVMYWEPAKWVARLRATKTDTNPLLFKISLDPAGHSGASGRYDRLRETAFDDAFLLRQVGIND
ncbi:MAG TPA: S9 family peptidase, partial [Polyangia bacterium]|nr:S9 family peptidase [Polyangia bacterium]